MENIRGVAVCLGQVPNRIWQMHRRASSISAAYLALLLAGVFAWLPGCGHPLTLIGLTIAPTQLHFSDTPPGTQGQFKAYGQFIHPTETRDITDQVDWSSAVPDLVTVDSNGVATQGTFCGSTVITATAGHKAGVPWSQAAILTATANFVVSISNEPACP